MSAEEATRAITKAENSINQDSKNIEMDVESIKQLQEKLIATQQQTKAYQAALEKAKDSVNTKKLIVLRAQRHKQEVQDRLKEDEKRVKLLRNSRTHISEEGKPHLQKKLVHMKKLVLQNFNKLTSAKKELTQAKVILAEAEGKKGTLVDKVSRSIKREEDLRDRIKSKAKKEAADKIKKAKDQALMARAQATKASISADNTEKIMDKDTKEIIKKYQKKIDEEKQRSDQALANLREKMKRATARNDAKVEKSMAAADKKEAKAQAATANVKKVEMEVKNTNAMISRNCAKNHNAKADADDAKADEATMGVGSASAESQSSKSLDSAKVAAKTAEEANGDHRKVPATKVNTEKLEKVEKADSGLRSMARLMTIGTSVIFAVVAAI
jgi:hypothetical protein